MFFEFYKFLCELFHLEIKLDKTIIKPIVAHGSEVWSITDRTASILKIWETKIMRKMYGPIFENEFWRIGSYLELQSTY
jgi:hypothetical protein